MKRIGKKLTKKEFDETLKEIEKEFDVIHFKGRYRHEQFWTTLSVEAIAKDPRMQRVVRSHVHALVGFPWKKSPIKAEIRIDAYLTKKVPQRLRVRTVIVRTEGDALVAAAKMYARIYAEDERLGGESAKKRNLRLKRQGKRLPTLINRTSDGPYIWGHDIGDLVFESISVTWKTPKSCVVTFGIGS